MRYYARAFPPAGGTTGARTKLVHLVRASTRLLLLAVASKIRSADLRPRVARGPAHHARARLPRGSVHARRVRPRYRAGDPWRLLVVLRLLQGPRGTPAELLDPAARTVFLPELRAALPPHPSQGISKTLARET